MKVAFAVLALGLISAASAYYTDGSHDPKVAFLVFSHADLVTFDDKHKKFVLQFNTCGEYELKIDQVELMQFRGKEMKVKKIIGGQNQFLVGLELSGGEGIANFDVRIWAQWTGRTKDVDHEKSYRLGSNWKSC